MRGGISMTGMQKYSYLHFPGELGSKIFREILSSGKVDREEMDRKAREIEREILASEYAEKKQDH